MVRQIFSLTFMFATLIFVGGVMTTDSADLQVRVLHLEHEDWAHYGHGTRLYAKVLSLELWDAWPWLLTGIGLGGVARWAAKQWGGVQALKKHVITDECGVTFTMVGSYFDHHQVFERLGATPVGQLVELTERERHEASELELQVLGALRASNAPADVVDAHGISLYQHTLNVWRLACAKRGVGTLEAIAALLHDAGKVLSFHVVGGQWVQRVPDHESLTLSFLRRLEGFNAIELPERDLLCELAAALNAPRMEGYRENVVEAVGFIKALDAQATGQEKHSNSKAFAAGEVDFEDLLFAIAAMLQSQDFGHNLNINRRANRAVPLRGIYDPAHQLLYVNAHAIREMLGALCNDHNKRTLSLRTPTQGFHPAYAYIVSALELGQKIVKVVGQQTSVTGIWQLRNGQTIWEQVLVIDATTFAEAQRALWGKPSQEISIKPVKA